MPLQASHSLGQIWRVVCVPTEISAQGAKHENWKFSEMRSQFQSGQVSAHLAPMCSV